MTTIHVRQHTRRKPERPADPFQAIIDARLAVKRASGKRSRPSGISATAETFCALAAALRKAVSP